MEGKPTTAAGYRPEQVQLARATCLYVATKLGDLAKETVVVGGLVPSLLIDQRQLPEGVEPHVGTLDLDLGLALAVLDHERYHTLAQRLRGAGFAPDTNEQGRPVRQRWRAKAGVTVDFLIAPSRKEDSGGRLRHIEKDFAALIAPGLALAFLDHVKVKLSGRTILGENAQRTVRVCGPGAFIVLKALAFDRRGENKDAYDLFYLLSNFGQGPEDIAPHLLPFLPDPDAEEALDILTRDFCEHEGIGPVRVATFIKGARDDAIQADVVGFVGRLLKYCGRRIPYPNKITL